MSKQAVETVKTVTAGHSLFAGLSPALTIVEVPLPELGEGVVVKVQAMTAGQRDRWEASMTVGKGKKTHMDTRSFRARLVIASVIDDDGNKVFTSADLPMLNAYPVKLLQRICKAATEASGLADDDDEDDDPLDDSGETAESDSASA